MARKLPWKRAEGASTSDAGPRPSSSRRLKSERGSDDEDDHGLTESKKRARISKCRTASKSPPPPSLQESSMVDGLENDDRYRMVEDEFLATALSFTAHLHAAEYRRLKAASKSENAEAIHNISRPVVGRMTDIAKLKQERKARLAKQRQATREVKKIKAIATDSEDEDWKSSSLHGLLSNPKTELGRLDGLVSTSTRTRNTSELNSFSARPSANTVARVNSDRTRVSYYDRLMGNQPKKEDKEIETADETEEDDSLEAQHAPQPLVKTEPPILPRAQPRQEAAPLTARQGSSRHHQKPQKPEDCGTVTTIAAKVEEQDSSDDANASLFNRMRKRREDRRRSHGIAAHTKSTSQASDDVPSFL
ncbi:hypothetical protein F4778DRAFT_617834 [Xylariomycetidae sp. FL2044]|nr:hypothetical protein F4778DRAFT_617834 [Xylariomycetidae sp. FL2044]